MLKHKACRQSQLAVLCLSMSPYTFARSQGALSDTRSVSAERCARYYHHDQFPSWAERCYSANLEDLILGNIVLRRKVVVLLGALGRPRLRQGVFWGWQLLPHCLHMHLLVSLLQQTPIPWL